MGWSAAIGWNTQAWSAAAAAPVEDDPPVNISLPVISGDHTVQSTLTASEGDWLNEPILFEYQWLQDDVPISDADSSTYVLVEADIDADISVIVTASNIHGEESATSASVGPINGLIPENTVAPTITGGSTPPEVGETLVANPGTWEGIPAPAFTYQWRAGAGGTTNIAGATNSTYELQTTEEGDLITVVVTGTNLEGNDSGTSVATGAVVSSGDVTAPVLSNFVATPVGVTEAILSVDTDEGNGTVYFVVVPTAATAPDATEIQAGTDGDSNPATWDGSVAASGIETWDEGPTGLTIDTIYDAYAVHVDASLNVSNIVTDEFTTEGAVFTPASLYAGSEEGAWFDPSDLSTLWQDTAGTVAVTGDGDPVGRVDDKSGNGNNWLQATAGLRPLYKTAGGLHWLERDGVDDALKSGTVFTLKANTTLAAAARYASGARSSSDAIITLASGTTNYFMLGVRQGIQAGRSVLRGASAAPAVAITTYLGATNSFPDTNPAVIMTELTALSHNFYKNGVSIGSIATTWDAQTLASMSLRFGDETATGAEVIVAKIYGALLIDRILTTGEREDLEALFAEKSGVTL